MPNYQLAKIYQLTCNITGQKYIGSTTQKLCRRLTGHVNDYKKGKILTSGKIIANGKYSIILIEDYPCDNKENLLKRERFYIESIECVNKIIPTRTYAEYYLDNIDKLKQTHKQYNIVNKEKFKEYRTANRDKIKQRSHNYYMSNLDTIKGKKAIKTSCPICTKIMRKDYLTRHIKSLH